MKYKIEKGKILSENGVPYLPRWFCDDLVTFEADKFGISKVEYFNQKTRGTEKIFVDDMWGGMKFYLADNGYHYSQKLKNCEVMPYGIKGEWVYGDSVFNYEQRVVNNTICVILKPVKMSKPMRFAAEFYDSWSFTPLNHGDFRYVNAVERIWNDWEYKDGTMSASCIDGGQNGTYVTIKTDCKTEYIKRDIGFTKNIIIADITDSGIMFVIAFDDSQKASKKRANDVLIMREEIFNGQSERYQRVMDNSPVLKSPYKLLNNFFALAPLYHESCKIPSVSGALHAKTEHYWVWGWDGMSSSIAYAYWDDMKFVGDMLEMYKKTADDENGIGHWFARDMSHIQTSPVPAQGFYLSLLYQYRLNGGNIEPYYAFAKKIYHLIASTEAKGTGLCEGYSLVPDFRETILENGKDLSAFNNSSLYCAVCAMRDMSKAMNDGATYEHAKAFADRIKDNYSEVLFDEEEGFFAASADSVTLERRKVFMAPSVKWDNLYCYDLVQSRQKELLEFFEKNFVCECGIMFAPVWGTGYDADANQMHCYWPAHSECFARLCNLENRKDLIEKLISWIECWTDILTCPEGIDCYDNINEPKTDGWTSINGAWQAYSMRAWYEAVVHSVIGVDFSENGLNIYPYDGEEITVENLHYNGKSFDIHMLGSGTGIKEVVLNGRNIGAVKEIQWDKFQQRNIVEITRE